MVARTRLDAKTSPASATKAPLQATAEARQKLREDAAQSSSAWSPSDTAPGREHIDFVVNALREEFDVPAPVMRKVEQVARGAVKLGVEHAVRSRVQDLTGTNRFTAGLMMDLGAVATGADRTASQLFEHLWPEAPPSPSKRAVDEALKSFLRPELSPEERRRILSDASQDPMTTLVLESIKDAAAFLPASLVRKGADGLASVVKANRERISASRLGKSRFAPCLNKLTNASEVAANIERLRAKLDDPGFRVAIANSLGVLRAFGRVQAEHLSALSLDLAADKKPAVQRAIEQYAVDVTESLIRKAAPEALPMATRALDLLRLTRLHLSAAEGHLRDREVEELVDTIKSLASEGTESIRAPRAAPPTEGIVTDLGRAKAKLFDALTEAGSLSAQSRHAAEELCADFNAVVGTILNLTTLVKAASNSEASNAQLFEDVKQAAAQAGPVVVKLAQTFGNLASERTSGEQDVIIEALKDLQEAVPHMSEAEVRKQVETELGRPIEKSFVAFDMTPLASASIAQIHRAVIKRPFLGERDVAVKVQRPNLDAEFDKTSRAARIALATVREVFPVIADFLESAGQTKDAEFLRSDGFNGKVRLVEDTIRAFVDSFAIETDFISERRNIQRFRRSSGIHPFVTAPHVFSQWSSGRVLTMDYVKLEKLPSLVGRAMVAREAVKEGPAPQTGPLPERTSDARKDVLERTLAHVRQQLGLRVTADDVVVAPVPGGFQAVIKTAHPLYPRVQLKFDEDGTLHDVVAPPKVDDARINRLRDRFFASLVAQVTVHGIVHGDPHKGNWGVASDGETVVMLDFGKMLELGPFKPKLLAPVVGAGAALTKGEHLVALSALAVSGISARDPRRDEIYREMIEAIGDLGTRPALERLQHASTAAVTVLSNHGIGLSEVYTQGIKVGLLTKGNFDAFSEASPKGFGWGSLFGALGLSTLDFADALTLRVAGTVGKWTKDGRLQRLHAEEEAQRR